FRDADQARRQDRPHRTRINPAIGVAAYRRVDRTMVHARRATDAPKHVLEVTAEERAAAVVEQHDMKLFRPVEIAWPPRTARHCCVCGALVAGGRTLKRLRRGR